MNRCRWFVCVSRNWKLEDTYNIKIGNKCVGCLPTKTTEYQAVNGGGDSEVGGGALAPVPVADTGSPTGGSPKFVKNPSVMHINLDLSPF
jgi:hypothetical protein